MHVAKELANRKTRSHHHEEKETVSVESIKVSSIKVSEYISVMMIRMIMMLMGPDDNYDDGIVIETMIFQIVADKFCADL